MTVMRLARRLVGALALGLVALSGCDKERPSTDAPGDERSAQLEAMEGKVGGADPAATAAGTQPGKQALPTVRDRDPEEEKRKMARSRAQSDKADDALTAGRLDQAIVAAREALRMHEQNVHAMLIIAEAYFRQGKYEIVQAVITSGLAVDPKIRTPAETSRLYNLQGFALLAMDKEQLATQSFKKAAENDEKNAAAWNNLGTRYLEAGDAKTALSCFSYAVELDARFYKAHLNRGAAQRAEGQWKEAEASFLTALELRPSYAEAYFDLGILYLDADPFPGIDTKQRLDKAISYLTKYRGLASSSGSSGSKGARVSKSGASPNVPAATREVADDYIRVARKGLERVQRDAEREGGAQSPNKSPNAAGASAAGGDETSPASAGAPANPDASQEPDAEPGSGTAREPGADPAPASPQKPGTKPAAKPAPITPQQPGPAAPQKPGAPASPPSTDAPPPASPPPTKPAAKPPAAPPTAPKPVAPQTPAPQPVAPKKPAPQPVSPQKPAPQPVAPQKPTPQPVSPQKPSSSASADLPLRNSSHTVQRRPRLRTLAATPAHPRKMITARGTRGVDSTLLHFSPASAGRWASVPRECGSASSPVPSACDRSSRSSGTPPRPLIVRVARVSPLRPRAHTQRTDASAVPLERARAANDPTVASLPNRPIPTR